MRAASKRARRMERHHQRRKQPALNLVSLMDIFTILVFFLLVSSSDVQQPPSRNKLKLPETISNTALKETLKITVTGRDILVEGIKVTENSDFVSSDGGEIPALKQELLLRAKAAQASDTLSGYSVTILGDEDMPYHLLSKILATCQAANYTQIAFAALQVSKKESL